MNSVLAPPAARAKPAASPAPRASAPHPPAAVVWVSGLVVVAAVVMAALGAVRTGISWDEPYHVMRLRNYLDDGWFALDWAVRGDRTATGDSNTLVYGPVTMLLLHGLGVLLGVDGWGSVATTSAAYDVRHVGVLLIGLVGTVAAAATTRILLGSWRWALVTAAALLALPMWTGHLMFNVKDVPVATGYTLTTLALVSMAGRSTDRGGLRIVALAAGTTLMVGTRPAMVTAVVAGLLVLGAGLAAGRTDRARRALAEAGLGLALAGIALALVYPAVFAHPVSLLRSAEQSASFRDGQDAVYGYVPFHVAAQVPLLLLTFFAVGLVAATAYVRTQWRVDAVRATRLALVATQLCALPLVAIVKHSDLYNGLRQLLFAAPAWAIVTTLGVARVLDWARRRGRTRLVGGIALAALAAPVADQAALFPYQYTYFNVALDATGVHVPSDYWRTSVPELLPRIPTDGQIVCGPTRSSRLGALAGSPDADGVDPGTMLAGRFSSDSSVDCRTDSLGPLATAWAEQRLPLADRLPHDTFYALVDRDHEVPANCTRLATVTRTRHGRSIAMTYVARCRLDPPALGSAPVRFTRTAAENMAPGLWAYAAEGWVSRASTTAVDASGTAASLTFTAPSGCAAGGCDLVLDADPPTGLAASVDDVPVTLSVAAESVVVPLPAKAGPTWVTFSRASGDPLDLRVRSIRINRPGTHPGTNEENR